MLLDSDIRLSVQERHLRPDANSFFLIYGHEYLASMHVYKCNMCMPCPWKAEKGVRSQSTGVTDVLVLACIGQKSSGFSGTRISSSDQCG